MSRTNRIVDIYQKIGLIAGLPLGAVGFGFGIMAWDDYGIRPEKKSTTALRVCVHAFSVVGFYSVGVVAWPVFTPLVCYQLASNMQ